MESRIYKLPNSEQFIVLMNTVIDNISSYIQEDTAPEAGGLLFAEFNLPEVKIIEASPPKSTDKRWRTLFIPNRILQRKLIKQKFKKGLHFVGEWHTHPVENPRPSTFDFDSMVDVFLKSKHELNYFVMIIAGNKKTDLNLWVSIHNDSKWYQLTENI